ncbi:hypothetical protein Tco_0199459 [Tanacetum coccineum]
MRFCFKAKKESSDEECLTFRSKDEEYAMAVRDFKKFFKRRECPNPPKDKNQRAFVGGSWSDNGEEDDEKAKDETCLVAQASNEVTPKIAKPTSSLINHMKSKESLQRDIRLNENSSTLEDITLGGWMA